MRKNIAIVTGASSGMGREFALTLKDYDSYDEVWAIARSKDKLEALKEVIPFPVKVVALDLTDDNSLKEYEKLLESEKPNIKLLINASGFGAFESVENIGYKNNMGMVDLNVRALTALTIMSLPYMSKGSQIVQFASLAAYQPIPYMTVYGASKAYVISFSRALNQELKKRGVHCMAVCPYWTKTAFFKRAEDAGKAGIVKKYVVMYESENIIKQAYKDLRKHKDVSVYGFVARSQTFLTKLLPHSLVMRVWMNQQELNDE